MAKRRVAAVVKIQIQAGAATPAPPVGTALGPHGINIMDFCKAYNAATEAQRGTVIPAEITIYEDRSFTFMTKTPPDAGAAAAGRGIEKGSAAPRREKVAQVTKARCARSPRRRCPTSTRSTSRARWRRSRARPVRWASRSSARVPFDVARRRRTSPADHGTDEGASKGAQPWPKSKKYTDATRRYDSDRSTRRPRPWSREVAGHRKFDETVEAAFRLGVDPRKADQMLRGTVSLPSGTGKDVRVAVFAAGDAARGAEAAGADVVGADDLVNRCRTKASWTSTSPSRSAHFATSAS